MAGGRPSLYTDPEEMQAVIDAYFDYCKAGEVKERFNKRNEAETITLERPATVTGLALALGYASVRSLIDVEQRKDEFSPIITRAKTRIAEDKLVGGLQGTYETRIVTLDLAANHGMSQKQEIQITDASMEDLAPEDKALVTSAIDQIKQGFIARQHGGPGKDDGN